MPYSHLISVPTSPFRFVPNTVQKQVSTVRVDCGHLQPIVMRPSYQILFLKKISRVFAVTHPLPKVQLAGPLKQSINLWSNETGPNLQSQLSVGSSFEQTNNKTISEDKNKEHLLHGMNGILYDIGGTPSGSAKRTDEDEKEIERRKKIGLANKGKTPWNKGRKHSAETRERIKQRTVEALSDPKVRKKMSECPHAHSVQSKARIGIALRRSWGERLKEKRSQEKCYLKWAESIAIEAKRGGSAQEELDWDSYDKMKAEIIRGQLQWAAEKAEAKEMAKLRAEKAAKSRSEKNALLAQKRKEKEQKAKAKRESKRKVHRKSEEEKQKLAMFKRLKLKAKLTKVHQKKSVVDIIASQREMGNDVEPAIEKWDLDFIKREKMRMEVSLADQLRAAKIRKERPATKEAQEGSLPKTSIEGRA